MEKEEIKKLIKELIEKITPEIKDITMTIEERGGSESVWFSVDTGDAHLFLGHEGEGLGAINHLVRRIIEPKNKIDSDSGKNKQIIIDINGFQKKKIDNIQALVHMMAERARYFKSSIELEPMSAFERRIVHEFLSDATDLKTESEGEGRNRRVVIKYIGGI